jgi:hypothetical protein
MADEKTPPPTSFFSKPPQRPSTPLPSQPASPPQPGPPPAVSPPAPSTTVAPLPAPIAEARPWIRCWARTLDIVIGGFVLGVILGLFVPEALDMSNVLLGFLIVFVWIFIETVLLMSWGTTPGKWMLSTTLRTARGAKLDGWAALSRSFDVWLRGLGVGIPLISLFTRLKAYNRLKAAGETLWDANGGFVVSHEPLRTGRLALVVLVVLAWVGLVVLGSQS